MRRALARDAREWVTNHPAGSVEERKGERPTVIATMMLHSPNLLLSISLLKVGDVTGGNLD